MDTSAPPALTCSIRASRSSRRSRSRAASPSAGRTGASRRRGPARGGRSAERRVAREEVPLDAALSRVGEFGAGLATRAGYVRFGGSLARAALSVLSYVPRLRRSIRAFGPDLLHINGLKMDLLGAWAC